MYQKHFQTRMRRAHQQKSCPQAAFAAPVWPVNDPITG
ncbi:hypothetical protein X805_01100 [Sphaerotilus natans subsp. natans DSM 6575]|jgi:hypothetical protein|uniref:Uncharacterized protein n=1 Tax=Sphaerotilus natans subsp. natans DSM 6575 TaxID=1286631 RepID=A0A059KSQ8_9BURK|nr:hypothetical protein X805_01100 [Sphaerotilus natans subsp. natans DSM 6575]